MLVYLLLISTINNTAEIARTASNAGVLGVAVGAAVVGANVVGAAVVIAAVGVAVTAARALTSMNPLSIPAFP